MAGLRSVHKRERRSGLAARARCTLSAACLVVIFIGVKNFMKSRMNRVSDGPIAQVLPGALRV